MSAAAGRRRRGALLIGAIIVGGGAAPPGPASAPAAPRDLPEGPWPPSTVLSADPRTVPAPPARALAAAAPCPPAPAGVHSRAPGSGKTVALTFDDGPGASTDAIIGILEDAGVAATFFNIGVTMTSRPATAQAEADQNFLLGNHTWSHPQLTTLTAAEQGTEMDRASAEQANIVGFAPCLLRPPYGSYNSTTLSVAE